MIKKEEIKKGLVLRFPSSGDKRYVVVRINRLTITLQQKDWVGTWRVQKEIVTQFGIVVKE